MSNMSRPTTVLRLLAVFAALSGAIRAHAQDLLIELDRLGVGSAFRPGDWTAARFRLTLRSGGRIKRLTRLFANPDLPSIDDYYEPATFDKDILVNAPAGLTDTPVKRPHSALTGEPMAVQWGPNWEDGLGGTHEYAGCGAYQLLLTVTDSSGCSTTDSRRVTFTGTLDVR